MKGQENKVAELTAMGSLNLLKPKMNEQQIETPLRIDLKLRLASHPDSLPSNFKTKKINTHSNEQQQNQQAYSAEMTGVNQFSLTTKYSLLPPKTNNIKSYLRIKPNKNVSFMPFEIYNSQTIVHDRSVYKFDCIFESDTIQENVYEVVGKEVTDQFIQGYNGTIFAYGSTGSGKTYTMFGKNDGIVPCVVEEIFSKLSPSHKLSCSMLQIYKQNLIDLLGDSEGDLKIKDINNACVIQNLSIHEIKTKQETLGVINRGNHLKKIRETDLNQCSSRSHIVFTLYLQKVDSEGRTIRAKFNLVDLAGSEKVFKSKVQGEGLQQAKKINLSLSCLGNTISALVKNSDHIPYRQSKLTRILRESLMGNSITRLIITCSINEEALEQTISSIKFAQRAQKVQTQAEISYNINKFKGQKEGKQKMVRIALQHAQTKLNKIIQKLQNEVIECRTCKEIEDIVKKKDPLQPEEIFNFNPISTYFSPKSKIDLRNYATNPITRFSSVPRREQSKKSSIKRTLGYQNEDSYELKTFENKKIFELKMQNERLTQEKKALEVRLKGLQEKLLRPEKQAKAERIPNKRVIKLGVNFDKQTPKLYKENQPNVVNVIKNKDQRQSQVINTDKTDVSISLAPQKEAQKAFQLKNVLTLINQCIDKFQSACEEFKNTICPLQTQVLKEEIRILESQFADKHINDQSKKRLSPILMLQSSLTKQICRYFQQISMILPKLFEASLYEYKQDFSMAFREREKSISEIKFNLKECFEDSDELQQLNNLLERSRCLLLEKEKERQRQKIQNSSSSKKKKDELESSYNEFLTIEKIGLLSYV